MILRLQEVEFLLDPVTGFADRELERLSRLRRALGTKKRENLLVGLNLAQYTYIYRYIDRVPETSTDRFARGQHSRSTSSCPE